MTSPAPDISLSSDEVRRHANAVDESATMLGEAVAGAAYVRASDESYGLLVGPMFTSLLNPFQDFAIDQIKHAAVTTTTLADLLRSMATASWSSQAAAAYRVRAKGHAEQVQALGEITETMAEMTLIAGALVGVVRNTVRDLIAEVVGAAVSKAVQALLVVTIPKIVAEVALMVAEYSSRILGVLKRLIAAIGKLTSKIGLLDGLLAQINRSLDEGINGALILGGHRFDAASDVHIAGPGFTSYRAAFGAISTGDRAVYGGVGQVSVDTAKAAPVSNGVQNAGSVADKIGDEQNPRPIKLPL